MLNELREENRTNCQTSIFRFSSIKLYRNQASMINRNRSPSPYTNQSIGKGLIKTSQSVEQYSVVVWRKRREIFEHSFSNQLLIASSDVILIKEFFLQSLVANGSTVQMKTSKKILLHRLITLKGKSTTRANRKEKWKLISCLEFVWLNVSNWN